MTTFQKSKALWIGGGLLGAVAGFVLTPFLAKGRGMNTAMGATMGSILVGMFGDVALERAQCANELDRPI